MKTTNNKLLDNTGNPVSHNRPIVKVVESVLVDGGHSFGDITYNGQFKDLCDCGKGNSNMKITYEQHLLQEIKSAIEKGKE